MASLGVASILIVAKFVAFLMTDSVSLLSSLFDSAFDLGASLVTAYGVSQARRPPDSRHRFGHGKAEPLAALFQSVFVVGSSLFLGFEAVDRFIDPHPIGNDRAGYVVMGLAIVLTLGLVFFQNRVIRRTGSMAIRADKLHYVGDLGVNLAVIIAFLLRQQFGIEWIDPLFALGITGALVFSAYRILQTAMAALMDEELPEKEREKIIGLILQHPDVRGVHALRTRTDGERIFIELHLAMDRAMSLEKAHASADRVEASLLEALPKADILIHKDPV
ncbi:MAG: cation diffusion facilitator family transporter [Alphaproteobacteria bacterium]|nr:cation diffusion facilitator family transporter [Alphaproteobacteria bacterium]